MTTHTFDRRADVEQALADPRLVPLPAETGPVGSMAWLRASVARFASGADHEGRRRLVEAELARVDPAVLRAVASAGRPDVGDRRRVVRALADVLDLAEPDAVAERILVVADNYFGGADPAADEAVAWLLPRMAVDGDGEVGGEPAAEPDLELAANRIGILVQACDATATLVANARNANPDAGLPVEALLTHTLRDDPPVRVMRRVAVRATEIGDVRIADGDLVLLDIASANLDPDTAEPAAHLTFGAPPRLCPGHTHAAALAAGVLDDDVTAPITTLVEHTLRLAETWPAWDGEPFHVDGRVYTPHKAVRRTADHLVDHLAELEARLAGEPPQPDHWHGSMSTMPADYAPFTKEDLDEARSRLTRVAQIWRNRLNTLTPEQLDHSPGEGWSFRELVTHLAGSVYYANSVGDLAVPAGGTDHA